MSQFLMKTTKNKVQRCVKILLLFTLFLACYKVFIAYLEDVREEAADEEDLQTVFMDANKKEIFKKWLDCAKWSLLVIDDPVQFWTQFTKLTKKCDEDAEIDKLGLITLKNKDEDKVAILPKNNDERHTFVTIGIGKDITGEQRWQRKMGKLGKTVEFYGADPMTEVNEHLYPQIGKYFPFAVAKNPGYATASVLINRQYFNQSVIHVDMMYFVERLLKLKTIDNLWMDSEGAEYDLFEIFEKDGSFDRNGIELCQVNLEVHLSETGPNNLHYERFMHFVKTLIKEERFAIFRTEEVIHMRMYMFNFDSDFCRRKY
ncbi:Methyltransferase FkbM domain-containing protein [Caenorhabditis elegans]|uniref:Methyltransferase FkbM domain-containing protein n=1 Tax=Caenorhabditis elegans TaxID=6239 RepID=H2FLH9_CAEEL|nr:Methyltransferase FkbM domain-containing protein [Caenorhabditis elegans]CCF23342.1 Methyltransferase FkbM domain-containing protein [Caenorhabditis elegans]|eukprot:NP_001256581.1 Uncharacterized protein CELE_F47B8.5 [Caenorhabditis elegans]